MKKIKDLALLFSVISRSNHLYIPILILSATFRAIDVMINVYIPATFIKGFEMQWTLKEFFYNIGLIIILKFICNILGKTLDRELVVQNEVLKNSFLKEISAKAISLSYDKLEDPKVLDLKERAIFPIVNYGALGQFLMSSSRFLDALFTIIGTLFVVLRFSPILSIISILFATAVIIMDNKMSLYLQKFSQKVIPINRKYMYYYQLMIDDKYQKEIRLYDLDDLIVSSADEYIGDIFNEMHLAYSKQANVDTFRIIMQSLIRLATFTIAGLRVLGRGLGGKISIGQFTSVIVANENFISAFQEAFKGLYEAMMNLMHLEPFSEFMRLEEDSFINGRPMEEIRELEFKNVSFTYPNTERIILDNISFKINKGEKISIVGLNNAGKSTIVKLILRFFKPDSGEILINGKDIEEYDRDDYLKSIACVFQDFALFPFSIKDNIIADREEDPKKLRAIIEETGIDKAIDKLPSGTDTMLNKSIYEDATDFSGGERQKVAISRALYRDSPLVILDEPTAALDPLAESEVYENFNDMTKDKTSIFISHRMSSSKFSDKILLLNDGKIEAFDSHENLMKSHNLYRDLFNAQAQYFN